MYDVFVSHLWLFCFNLAIFDELIKFDELLLLYLLTSKIIVFYVSI